MENRRNNFWRRAGGRERSRVVDTKSVREDGSTEEDVREICKGIGTTRERNVGSRYKSKGRKRMPNEGIKGKEPEKDLGWSFLCCAPKRRFETQEGR